MGLDVFFYMYKILRIVCVLTKFCNSNHGTSFFSRVIFFLSWSSLLGVYHVFIFTRSHILETSWNWLWIFADTEFVSISSLFSNAFNYKHAHLLFYLIRVRRVGHRHMGTIWERRNAWWDFRSLNMLDLTNISWYRCGNGAVVLRAAEFCSKVQTWVRIQGLPLCVL